MKTLTLILRILSLGRYTLETVYDAEGDKEVRIRIYWKMRYEWSQKQYAAALDRIEKYQRAVLNNDKKELEFLANQGEWGVLYD